jgi:hypothetical protein
VRDTYHFGPQLQGSWSTVLAHEGDEVRVSFGGSGGGAHRVATIQIKDHGLFIVAVDEVAERFRECGSDTGALRRLALSLVFGEWAEHPDLFADYIDSVKDRSYLKGERDCRDQIRSVLGVGDCK